MRIYHLFKFIKNLLYLEKKKQLDLKLWYQVYQNKIKMVYYQLYM